jgi:hypothetical protein
VDKVTLGQRRSIDIDPVLRLPGAPVFLGQRVVPFGTEHREAKVFKGDPVPWGHNLFRAKIQKSQSKPGTSPGPER